MSLEAPPGVFDILPLVGKEPWRSSYLWQYVEEVMRATAHSYGYREVRTPMFERTELFIRSIGEHTDVVNKEMYTFTDKGNRSLTLRPEGTAPVMRAFIEHQLQQEGGDHRFFYIAPMFRYERSQAGRYRQHHQFGVEAIGCATPEQDAEVIDMLYTLYSRLQLQGLEVSINTLGTAECRERFRTVLIDYLRGHQQQLSEDSRRRLEANPCRILDSKDPGDRAAIAAAPSIHDFLNAEARDHFEQLLSLLDSLKIPYKVTPLLMRGLDYYNKTVFEVASGSLGAQDSIGGGGRYDGLLKALGGSDLPSIGFGTGIERILQVMLAQQLPLPTPPRPTLYLIPLGAKAKQQAFLLMQALRRKAIAVQMDLTGRKLGKAMQQASQLRAHYVAVIGDRELDSGLVELKQMETAEVQSVSIDALEILLSSHR